jgi:hypothetical protein
MTQPEATILAAVISVLLGGVAAAVVTYLLMRRKTDAEIEKIRTETEKLGIEMRILSESVSYSLPQVKERMIFDGRGRIDGFDVKGAGGSFWTGMGQDARPISPRGEGSHHFQEGGVLNIQRTNTDGRYELILQQYLLEGKTSGFILKDESIGGKRKLRIACEAKTIGGEHTLRFVVRDPSTGRRFSEDVRRISGNDWTPVEAYLTADPTVDCQVRLDDEGVSAVPSSLQIRNLIVAERLS